MKLLGSVVGGLFSLVLSHVPLTLAQTLAEPASALPRLVRFGGAVKGVNGDPLTGVVGITFALYSEQTGGVALWLETQNVNADNVGHYTVLLGSTEPDGLPTDLFTSEQARWLGVQVSGRAEQPRVLLVSVPYALKARDAETINGLPPSAFMLAAPGNSGGVAPTNSSATASTSGSAPPPASSDVTTTGGTVNTIPLFTTATNIQNSVITQTGSGATAKIGIGITAPAPSLDIKGGEYVRGTFTLPSTATATAAKGADSQPDAMIASVFNSSTSTAVNQKFQLQAEPAGNNTATASGTLNLLYGSGTATPAETGPAINSKGQIAFARGQTFPGTGPGTITGVTTAVGSGLSGGGTTGTLKLTVPAAGITNAMLQHSSVTVSAGTGLTGGGSVALGDSTSLGVNFTLVPELGAANTFTNTNTMSVDSSNPALTVANPNGDGLDISSAGSNGIRVAAAASDAKARFSSRRFAIPQKGCL